MVTLIDMKKNMVTLLMLTSFLLDMDLGLLKSYKMFVFVDGLYLLDIWFSLEYMVSMMM